MYDYERIVLKSQNGIKINVELIPEYQRCQLAELASEVTREVFSRPGEEEHYQEWLKGRQQKEM